MLLNVMILNFIWNKTGILRILTSILSFDNRSLMISIFSFSTSNDWRIKKDETNDWWMKKDETNDWRIKKIK